MKLKSTITALMALTLLASAASSYAADRHDAMRVVSLKPVITDILVALGASGNVVGATKYCDFSKFSARPAIVGDYTRPFIEKIVALSPDLVLNSEENSSRRSFERLASTGTEIKLFKFGNPDEIIESIKAIGIAVGREKEASELAKEMKDQLAELQAKWGKFEKKKGIIVWGRRPIIIAGDKSYIGQLLPIIGIENSARAGSIPYPRIGLEDILAMNPDFIIDLSMGSESANSDENWSRLREYDIYKKGRIFTLNADDFRPGPQLPDSLENLARLVHEAK